MASACVEQGRSEVGEAIKTDSNEFLTRRPPAPNARVPSESNLLMQKHVGPVKRRHALLFDHMSTRYHRSGYNHSQRQRGLRVDDKFKIASRPDR
jgi:hypothetical protein